MSTVSLEELDRERGIKCHKMMLTVLLSTAVSCVMSAIQVSNHKGDTPVTRCQNYPCLAKPLHL